MNLLDLLRNDHSTIEGLFDEVTDALEDVKQRKALFKKLSKELKAHTEAEEEVFYTALEAIEEERMLALRAREEHRLVEQLLGELQDDSLADEVWEAKFHVFRQLALEHIEAEEDEMFEEAEEALEEELDALATRFKEEKAKYM